MPNRSKTGSAPHDVLTHPLVVSRPYLASNALLGLMSKACEGIGVTERQWLTSLKAFDDLR